MLGKSDDPGRKWRRLARCGALACLLATILPFEHGKNLWSFAGELFDIAIARGVSPDRGIQGWFVLAFCCMAVPYFFSGPVFILLCSTKSMHEGPNLSVQHVLLQLLWAATAVTPYIAVYCQLATRQPAKDSVGVVIGVLSVYLLLSGLTFLASRRVRNTPLFIFCMGLMPIGVLCLAATSLMIALLLGGGGRVDWAYLDVPLGFAGSWALLVGWLNWWSAVNRAMRTSMPMVQAARS